MTSKEILQYPDTQNGSPAELADQWLVYLSSGQVSEAGQRAFSQWLQADPANHCAYTDAEQLWLDLGFVLMHDDMLAERAELAAGTVVATNAAPADKLTKRYSNSNWLVAAAASVLLMVSLWFSQPFFTAPPAAVDYISQVGEIRQVQLPDNSMVTLSAASHLQVQMTDNARLLTLIKGRAYFEVAKDSSRPFTVSAANTSITALGTAFDINRTHEGIDVAVTHGIVDVKAYLDEAHTQAIAGENVYAGQQIHSAKQGKLSAVKALDVDNKLSWKSGRLAYQNEKLSVITEEINRYRQQKIRLVSPVLQNKRITLSLPSDQTDLLISAIKASDTVIVTQTATEIVIDYAI